MGCVSSKPDINDQHPNIFHVTNVNEQGELISPGQIEVTETELVLYQRGKSPTIWPLRSLRKYGFDLEIFSFECGRRCPTGEGIYAFRCRRAEQLFNIVQQNIIRNTNNDDNNPLNMNIISPNSNEYPIPIASTGPPVQRRTLSQTEGYLNPITAPTNTRPHPTLSRPGSIASNGPISPPAITPPPLNIDNSLEHNNNNKRTSLINDPPYTNTNNIVGDVETIQTGYTNLGNINCPNVPNTTETNYVNVSTTESPCHLYMNTNLPNTKELIECEDDAKHCYANIDTKEFVHLKPILKSNIDNSLSSVPQTPTALYVTIREVNYAELDLDPSKNDVPSINSQTTPDSPNSKTKKSYATIDFQRTNALSQSINPGIVEEEGIRKTRHNSTISDVTTRHSNSLSD